MDNKPNIHEAYQDIIAEIQKLQAFMGESDRFLHRLNDDQEQLILRYQERNKYSAMANASLSPTEQAKYLKNLEQLDALFRSESDKVVKDRANLIERCSAILNRLTILQKRVLDGELERWRRGQQLAGNGVAYLGCSLDEIQVWCENLADLIWKTRMHIARLQIMCQNYTATEYITNSIFQLMDLTTALLQRLVKSAFVIEKQPPQVMKTNTRFTR